MNKVICLLLTAFFCQGCANEKADVLNQIDGTWRVSSVESLVKGYPDSLLTNRDVLVFESCTKRSNAASNCTLALTPRNESFRFFYLVHDGKTLLITPDPSSAALPGYSALADRLEGTYRILALDERDLWVKKEQGCDQLNAQTRCERVNLKASR